MQLPETEILRDRIARYAELIATRESDFGPGALVLPNAEYFPDVFSPDAAGVGRLLARMQKHASLTDIPIEVELDSEVSSAASSCGSGGACGELPSTGSAAAGGPSLVALEHGWVLRPNVLQLRHPVALTTLLARMLGAIFVEETRPDAHRDREPSNITAEIAAVALGFGVLLLEGSHVYSKSCGGPQVACLTELSPGELAALTALFAAHRRHSLGPAQRAASPTQAALLSTAKDWIQSNAGLARSLNLAPSDLCAGSFELRDPSSHAPSLFTWIRSWSRDRADRDLERALGAANSPRGNNPKQLASTRKRSEADEQLRALVENVLAERHD